MWQVSGARMGQGGEEPGLLCTFRSNLNIPPSTTCSVKVPTGSILQDWSKPSFANFSFLVANSTTSWGRESISSGAPGAPRRPCAAPGGGNTTVMKTERHVKTKQQFIIRLFRYKSPC